MSQAQAFLGACTLLMLGKFYYFTHGWVGHLKPLAPVWVVVLKDVGLVALLGAAHWHIVRRRLWDRLSLLLLGFCVLWMLVSLPHLARLSVQDWLQHYCRNVWLPMLLLPVAHALLRASDTRRFLDCLLALSVINAGAAFASFFLLRERLFDGRAIGLMENPITLAGVLSQGILICVIRLVHDRNPRYLPAMVTLLVALVLASSTTYIVALAVVVGIIALRSLAVRRAVVLLGAVGALVSAILLASGAVPTVAAAQLDRLSALMINPSEEHSLTARLGGYVDLLVFLGEADPFQVLFGNFGYPEYFKRDSIIVGLAFNMGLLGLVAHVGLFLAILGMAHRRQARRAKSEEDRWDIELLKSSLVLFLLSALANNNSYRFPLNVIAYVQAALLLRQLAGLDLRDRPNRAAE